MAESWNRPYHEGLKHVREQMGYKGKTNKSIDAGKVRPNGLYVNHEAYKHSIDLMRGLAQESQRTGQPVTADMVKNAWLNHPVLSKHTPFNRYDISQIYGVRRQDALAQGAMVAENPDVAQQAVEAQQNVGDVQMPQSPMDGYRTWFDDFKNEKGRDLYANSFANKRFYLPKLHQQIVGKYYSQDSGRDAPDMETVIRLGTGRAEVDRLVSGHIKYLQQQFPGIQPLGNRLQPEVPQQPAPPQGEVVQPPQEQVIEQAQQRAERRAEQPRPPPPPAEPLPPPPPPVPVEQPPPPVPVEQPPPPVPAPQIPPIFHRKCPIIA